MTQRKGAQDLDQTQEAKEAAALLAGNRGDVIQATASCVQPFPIFVGYTLYRPKRIAAYTFYFINQSRPTRILFMCSRYDRLTASVWIKVGISGNPGREDASCPFRKLPI